MKKILLNIISVSLILMLGFMAFGIELHFHTCGKTGSKTVEIIETPECSCEHLPVEVESSCCSSEEHNCSSNNDLRTEKLNDTEYFTNLGCCQDEILLIAINDAFVNHSPKSYFSANNAFTLIRNFFLINYSFDSEANTFFQQLVREKSPPEQFTSIIRFLHHSSNPELPDSIL